MAGKWPVGHGPVRFFVEMPEPYATWYAEELQKWGAFGIVAVERVASAEECDVHALFATRAEVPPPDLALTEMPVAPVPGVPLLSRFVNTPPYGLWDEALFREAAGHEIGHSLGLDHSANPRSIMAPVDDRVVQEPSAVDEANLRALYPEAAAAPAPTTPDPTGPAGAMPIGQIGRALVQVPTPEGQIALGITYLPAVLAAGLPKPPDGAMVIVFQPSKAVAVVQFVGLTPLPAADGPAPESTAPDPGPGAEPVPAPVAPAQETVLNASPVPEVSPMGPLVLLLTSSLRAEFAHLLAEQLQAGAPLDVAAKTVAAAIEAKTPAGPLRDVETAVLDALIKVVENVAAAAAPPAAAGN